MNKTFAELGYNVGDTVRCVDDGGRRFYVTGGKYVLESSGGLGPTIKVDHNGYSASWELVSRAGSPDTTDDGYLIWNDMTPEAQGSLLLSEHNGAIIQFFCLDEWILDSDPNWWYARKYRVKPAAPVVVTHEIYGRHERNWNWVRDSLDTHTITYNTLDGVVDCSSVVMTKI